MHLLTKRLVGRASAGAPVYQIADPLLTIARTVRQALGNHEKGDPGHISDERHGNESVRLQRRQRRISAGAVINEA
jgi:hypothetical protein